MTIERVASTMVALAATCCTADATPPNLIVNGSFEDPVLTSGFSVFPSIPGWTGGEGGIEIQADRVGGFTARGVADGEQFVELDTLDENSLMFQDVPTQANSTYVLSLAFAPRQLAVRPRNSNNVEVLWEGSQVALLGGPSAPGDFRLENWLTYSYELTAQSATGSSRLQFQALGPADGKGGLIDRVSLVRTPEPMAIVLLVLGVCASGYRLRTT